MSEQQDEPRWLVTIRGARRRLWTFSVPASELEEWTHPVFDHTWELVETRPDPTGPEHPA